MALAELDYMKDVLGVTTDAQDVQLRAFLDAADRAVKNWCQTELESADYTEYLTGGNQPRIAVRNVPVTAVAGVWVHDAGHFGAGPDAFGSATALVSGVDYALDVSPGGSVSKSGILFRLGTVWPMRKQSYGRGLLGVDFGPAWGNIKVSYTAGYECVPADLQMAVVMVAQAMRKSAPEGGRLLESEKLGDYSYRLAHQALLSPELGAVRTTLGTYRLMPW